MKRQLLLLIPLAFCMSSRAQTAAPPPGKPPGAAAESTAAYEKVTQERAAKIVATLAVTNTNRAARACDLIARQYQDLSRLHAERDAQIVEIKKQTTDKAAVEEAVKSARTNWDVKISVLHSNYLSKLGEVLTPGQVDQVKDGMTYGVAPNTYKVYLKMYPAMTDEQKTSVLSMLLEARELAMDAGSSDAKHAVFGKYKGRINNYLSKQGFNAREGERNLKNSDKPSTNTQTNSK